MTPELLDAVDHWLAQDPNPALRAEIEAMRESSPDALAALFDGRLRFGTAGLRAQLGPGPNRMNRLVVRQTTAGLMSWLKAGHASRPKPLVVIGYDARHLSEAFAEEAARVVAGAGGRARLMDRMTPTPVLANAVLAMGADAGVMITASHNPPRDNGYKLYLADGLQLVSPTDAEIAAAIDVAASNALPVAPVESLSIVRVGAQLVAAHRAVALSALCTTDRDVSIVYTAMHGVGGAPFLAALDEAGFPPPTVVDAQFAPDPDFATVSFPNPEEPGALDLAFALAAESDADVILAHDPDADRLGVAVRGRSGSDGWVALNGNQIGWLLADHLLRHSQGDDRLVSTTIVSSQMLSAMAEAAGVETVTTLTGFKWVARPIVDRPDKTFIFGYEEALGYLVTDGVRDKDGISAGLVFAELMAGLNAAGKTVWDRLDELAAAHGVHATAAVTLRFDGAQGMAARASWMERARTAPPAELADMTLVERIDLTEGGEFPPTEGVVLRYGDALRVVVRPSGTEPKLKSYLELVAPICGSVADTRIAADLKLQDAADELRAFFS